MFFKRRIYLDYAAGVSGNPSSPHEEGRNAKHILEEARRAIARLTEVQADDVIFTGGATEANALAILGHTRALREKGQRDIHILCLPSAHSSLVKNAELAGREGVKVEMLPIRDARVDIDALKKMLTDTTALIAMEAVCGETGVIWNTREVKTAIGDRPIVLHVDASQAPATEKLTRAHFGADMLTLDASKVSAARGIGALIAHRTIPLLPLYEGGGQERGHRSGSESPELAKVFAEALITASKDREAFRASAEEIRTEIVASLTQDIPRLVINEGRSQVPHILNVSLPGRDTDYIVALLDEAGIAVSTKSACETDSELGSRAVAVLFNDEERARATLRISWHKSVSRSDLLRFVSALEDAVAFVDTSRER